MEELAKYVGAAALGYVIPFIGPLIYHGAAKRAIKNAILKKSVDDVVKKWVNGTENVRRLKQATNDA